MAANAASSNATLWPVALRSQIARLADVSYRIGRVAAPRCPTTYAGTGISLDYIEAYSAGDRAGVAALLGMTDMPQIAAVAGGSPAQSAGVRPGDALIAINGVKVSDLLAADSNRALFADALEQRLALTPDGTPIVLGLRRNGTELTIRVLPVRVCGVRVVIKTDQGIAAYTDGDNVAVSSGLVRFAANDDELALLVGHEIGHVINRDGKAHDLEERRRMEDRADIAGANLLVCSGYNLDTALDFWARFNARDWLRWAHAPTHRSTKARIALIRQAAPTFTCPATTIR